jgi:hypothetical protein
MPQDNGIMRFKIDGRWTAANMVASLGEVSFLYNLRLYLDHVEGIYPYYDDFFFHPRRSLFSSYLPLSPILLRPDDIQRLAAAYFPDSELQIARIKYASPGETDFLGIGASLKAVCAFVKSLLTIDEDIEFTKLRNNAQRIENARSFVRLRLERERAEYEIAKLQSERLAELVADNTHGLQRLVEENQITDVMMLEDKIRDEY